MTEYQEQRIKELKDNRDGNIIYSLWSNNYGDSDCFGYFKNYDNAYNLGIKLQSDFNIQVDNILDTPQGKGFPEEVDDDEQKFYPACEIAVIRYTSDGEVFNIMS